MPISKFKYVSGNLTSSDDFLVNYYIKSFKVLEFEKADISINKQNEEGTYKLSQTYQKEDFENYGTPLSCPSINRYEAIFEDIEFVGNTISLPEIFDSYDEALKATQEKYEDLINNSTLSNNNLIDMMLSSKVKIIVDGDRELAKNEEYVLLDFNGFVISVDGYGKIKTTNNSSLDLIEPKSQKEKIIPYYFPNGTYNMQSNVVYKLIKYYSDENRTGTATEDATKLQNPEYVSYELGTNEHSDTFTKGNNYHNVIVHTPVINYAKILENGIKVNQKVGTLKNEQDGKYYLMLDDIFILDYPNSNLVTMFNDKSTPKHQGETTSEKGYSNTRLYNNAQGETKDNSTWGIEDVKFPFDVYVHEIDSTTGLPSSVTEEDVINLNGNNILSTQTQNRNLKKYFLPKGTWLSTLQIDNNKFDANGSKKAIDTIYAFTIPVWVREGTYGDDDQGNIIDGAIDHGIMVRVCAENAYDENGNLVDRRVNMQNKYANNNIISGNSDNAEYTYVATNTINCEVLGKIYDVTVNSSNDPSWTDVYSSSHNKNYISAVEVAFGQKGHNKNSSYQRYLTGVNTSNILKIYGKNIENLPYQYKGKQILSLYGSNNTRDSIINDIENNSKILQETIYKSPNINNANRENGEQYLLGSVGHWFMGFRLPKSTIAIKNSDIRGILQEIHKTTVPDNANEIVQNAISKNIVLNNGYIGVRFDIMANFEATDKNNYKYLKYKGPEVQGIVNGENYNYIYYNNENKELSNEINIPNGSKVKKESNELYSLITLPNGRKQYVPSNTIMIFETDLNASTDVTVGQDF